MFTGLWRNPDFVKLWIGQTASQTGSLIRIIALPLTAIVTLNASPFQVGLLVAISAMPSLVVGPIAGAFADRRRRRPILIATDWLRAGIIALVPIAYFADVLHMWMLYLAALGMGSLSLLFEVTYRSYLPSLVARNELVEGNSKLELGRSAAEVAGPGAGGGLVQLLGAPVALLVDAGSFVVSAISLHAIKKPEPEPSRTVASPGLVREAMQGVRHVMGHELLRPIVISAALIGIFNAIIDAVFILYMTDALDLSPGLIGLVFSVGGAGLVAGAILANRIVGRFGIGMTIFGGVLMIALSDLALPLAGGQLVAVLIVLIAGGIGFSFGLPLYRISQTSLSQAVTEPSMHGRMNATFHLAWTGTIPIGALIGGLIGEFIGLREALFIGVAGEGLAAIVLLLSPVRRVRALPEQATG